MAFLVGRDDEAAEAWVRAHREAVMVAILTDEINPVLAGTTATRPRSRADRQRH